jgi:putative membrane protein
MGAQSRSRVVFNRLKETHMTTINRRTFLVAVAIAPIARVAMVHAVDALPDARFVGFAETVNDFEIKSGQLALTKSTNELVRGFATRSIAEHTKAAESLARNRTEAGVSMAPDEDVRKISDEAMARLNSVQGAEFDTAYATAQVRVQTAAVDQYGAYSQNGKSGPLRRYAQETLPQLQALQEYAKRLAGGR